jgi:hypothetical protein
MTRADKFLIAVIILVALGGLGLGYRNLFSAKDLRHPAKATISVQGKVLRTLDLDSGKKGEIFPVSGRCGTATVEVGAGRIRVATAKCPEQICVKQGWVDRPGEAIVCLPGEIVIRIDGPTAVDAVTR